MHGKFLQLPDAIIFLPSRALFLLLSSPTASTGATPNILVQLSCAFVVFARTRIRQGCCPAGTCAGAGTPRQRWGAQQDLAHRSRCTFAATPAHSSETAPIPDPAHAHRPGCRHTPHASEGCKHLRHDVMESGAYGCSGWRML